MWHNLEKYFQFGPKFKLDHKITVPQLFNNSIGISNLPLLNQVNNAKKYFVNGSNAVNLECSKVGMSRTSAFFGKLEVGTKLKTPYEIKPP